MIFVQQLVKAFPFKICKVQTDNGFEFTKRFTKARMAINEYFYALNHFESFEDFRQKLADGIYFLTPFL